MSYKSGKYYKDGRFYDIPSSRYYVISTDTCMSYWGPCKGKKNICIVPCTNKREAEKVLAYVKTRTDQEDALIINGSYPFTENSSILYSLVPEWIKRANEI